MTLLNLRISPNEASTNESKVSLSDAQKHSAFATSKLPKMVELVVDPSIGCKTIRSRDLPSWIQVNSSVAHHRREEYVAPARTTSWLQPARKTGSGWCESCSGEPCRGQTRPSPLRGCGVVGIFEELVWTLLLLFSSQILAMELKVNVQISSVEVH